MRRRVRRRRSLLLAAVAGLTAALGIATYLTDRFRDLELDGIDQRFEVRGEREPPEELVVVLVDDVTFDRLGEQWPFPRSLHGEVIDRIRRDGARAIVVDIQFTEESEPDEDLALYDAVSRARGRIVLATTETGPRGQTKILGGDENLRAAGARAGNALFPPDPGGVYRRLPREIGGLEGLAVAGAEIASGRRIGREEVGGDSAWIDFYGPPGTIPAVHYSDVVQRRTAPGAFRDKIVVIGAAAPTLQDVHPTSTTGEELMAGAEIQAHALGTALAGFPLDEAPDWLAVVLILAMAVLVPAIAARLRLGPAVVAALVAVALYLVAAQLAFGEGLILPLVHPLGALAVALAGSLAVYYITAALERERARDLFARFVPEQVVDSVLGEVDEELRLGGVRRECTVLFSDVRGFTTFSETRPPEVVIEVLNRYLATMSDTILDHGGTLTSFMGDGIMAIFGAPLDQPDHADRALAAAREMLGDRLAEFNDWARAEGISDGFGMGVGLNTGPVMCGNVGSERRCEYTAIGDTVNTASRLEGLTKGTKHQLFVAESTREALLQDPGDLVFAEEVDVRGRAQKVRVWTVAEARVHTGVFEFAPGAGEEPDGADPFEQQLPRML